MKRMEVPRLPLHSLQVRSRVPLSCLYNDILLHARYWFVQGGLGQAEFHNPGKPAEIMQPQEPVALMSENQSEPSPPPSRILRSGKRVPIGTAAKVPPRTASKASRGVPATEDANTQVRNCMVCVFEAAQYSTQYCCASPRHMQLSHKIQQSQQYQHVFFFDLDHLHDLQI